MMADTSGFIDKPEIHRIGKNIYGKYCIPISSEHRVAAKCILRGKIWEEWTLRFMRNYSGEGDVIHAGAYFGDFLPALSHAMAPGAKVWAFEPNPENYAAAVITCRLNDLHNVELINGGIGDASGMMQMRVRAEQISLGGLSTMVATDTDIPSGDLVEVPIYKIDDVVPRDRKISILQLDVEGFEQPALVGATETIRAWQPILILETIPPEWLATFLSPMKYEIRGRLHENTVFSVSKVSLPGRTKLHRVAVRIADLFHTRATDHAPAKRQSQSQISE